MDKSLDRTHYQATFAVLAAGVAAYALLQSLVTPVLPTIQADLHTNQNTVTWVLTAYLLSASVFTPILGRIGDAIGKERMFVTTLVFLAVGSLLAALAPNIGVMIAARVIQGVGGGALPLAFGIIRDEFPREKVAGAVGLIAALIAVGGGLGIVLAGPIVDALDWHWLFWIPLIMTALAAVAAYFFVPESPVRTPGRINWAAAVLLSGWLVALLVAVSEAPTWGWGSGKVIGLLVVAIAVMVGWYLAESRSDSPLIDMKMMRLPAVWTTNLVGFLFGIGMYSVFAFLPEFLQTPKSTNYGFGASITKSGLVLLPMSVAMFAVGTFTGRFVRRIGAKAVLATGAALSIVPFVLLVVAHAHIWEMLISMALLGAGFGLSFSAMSALIVEAVKPEQTGVASGMNANIRTIGGAIGASLMASIVTSNAATDGLPREAGYTHGFIFLAVAAVAAAGAALLIPRVKRTLSKEEELIELAHTEVAMVAAAAGVDKE